MSQMMVTGRRKAKSSIRSILPCGNDAVEGLIDDLLDARTHVLDPAGSKGFRTRPRRRVWSGGSCCSIQWLMLRRDRLFHDVRPVAANGALDVVLAEALVAHPATTSA